MSALALLAAAAVSAGVPSSPSQTAGSGLRAAWSLARRDYRDAVLISIWGAVGPDGLPLCRPQAPFENGWRYTFYSPAKKEFVMTAACSGKTAGPLLQMRSKSPAWKRPISGSFIDSDQAMRALEKSGFDLDPRRHAGVGQRPYTLELSRLPDEELEAAPAVWKISIGDKTRLIDAAANEPFDRVKHSGPSRALLKSSATVSAILGKRGHRSGGQSALQDLEAAQRYARMKAPGAQLVAVEGFVDAWGRSPCTGPGDGWAYYFQRRSSDFLLAVFSCAGKAGPGPARDAPIEAGANQPLALPLIDSDRAVDALLSAAGDVFSEGMGRDFGKIATARLTGPKTKQKQAPRWEFGLGRRSFAVDARDGRYLGEAD